MRQVDAMSNPADDRAVIEAKIRGAAMTEFASRAGHDMLGPLNQVGSLLALFVKRYRDQLDSEAELLLDFVLSAVSRMESVTAGMQEFLRLAAATRVIEQVDLNGALAVACVSLEPEVLKTGAVIKRGLLPDRVRADRRQMAALFEILLSNALRFRAPDEAPEIRVTAERGQGGWTISVEDNGIGVDQEYRETILLPFQRLNGREYPGAGLGLAIAKLITELNGGVLRVEAATEFARGTKVLFTIPDEP
jgi:light-regulated signal transduction histidine kinase (bacteriophytochrome)